VSSLPRLCALQQRTLIEPSLRRMRKGVRRQDRVEPCSTREHPDDDCARTHDGALFPRERRPLVRRRFARLPRRGWPHEQTPARGTPDRRSLGHPRRVAELRAATEENFGPRDSSGHHDQYRPSGVGATSYCRGSSRITRAAVTGAPSRSTRSLRRQMPRLSASKVHFTPAARTAWAHPTRTAKPSTSP
jgi:hypothetical protein